MKQGGSTGNSTSKKGLRREQKCSICGRNYAIKEHKDRHEKQCKEFNEGHRQK